MNGCQKCSCPIHADQRATQTDNLRTVTNANQIIKEIKKEVTTTEIGTETGTRFEPVVNRNTRVISGGGLRSGSIRNSRVTRKTVYGEKYDYGEKIREKRNYVLYASGTMREKKEIEQIEQTQPQPTILEEREIIDNYKYHEFKNIKNQNPNRLSFTLHKRLS